MLHNIDLPNVLPSDHLEIGNGRESLAKFQAWLREQFMAGCPVGELVAARSLLIDQLLTLGWEQFGLGAAPRLSLVAVGGYGRGELHPNSDIDILILSPEPLTKQLGETIGAFLTLLWDLKLEGGHAVRSV